MAVQYVATINGYEFGFDFEDQRIDVDVTLTMLDVSDLWEAIKVAQASQIGIVYPKIATGEGKTVLSSGISTYLTVILHHNWELNTLLVSGKFEVAGGNLVREDEQDPFRDNPLITYINQVSQAGVIATVSTGSGLSNEQDTQLMALGTLQEIKQLLLTRINTISNGKISQYETGLGDVVDVVYDNTTGLPISEEIQ